MIDKRPGPRSPFNEDKLRLVREFLQREFPGCRRDDYFDPAKTAQVFVIEPHRRPRHVLIIPKGTLEHPEFARLCNAQLAETLKLERESRIVLTPQGPVLRA
jgi:hypothetical protein